MLQVLLVSVHEHLAAFVFVHQKWQQGFQLQLINGLSLAVCYIMSSFKERIQKMWIQEYKIFLFHLHNPFLFLKVHEFLPKMLLKSFSVTPKKFHLRLKKYVKYQIKMNIGMEE